MELNLQYRIEEDLNKHLGQALMQTPKLYKRPFHFFKDFSIFWKYLMSTK